MTGIYSFAPDPDRYGPVLWPLAIGSAAGTVAGSLALLLRPDRMGFADTQPVRFLYFVLLVYTLAFVFGNMRTGRYLIPILLFSFSALSACTVLRCLHLEDPGIYRQATYLSLHAFSFFCTFYLSVHGLIVSRTVPVRKGRTQPRRFRFIAEYLFFSALTAALFAALGIL